ncbi:SAM-dependent methyltransferase [Ramlibacter rhizophilus]|uniref:Class I SAM-dependent methyltransferase n=1 Tax=Ramlibacter rhizophilus TaxID=1781167 RepID=A0A4Z0C0Z8_9BURK|nr:methyltransferase domain-containing protein [Ramlibacter rhizophilus]TFZ04891.1 class I SAM-dependent methyltransferase [Ramlibacter rhizophilus]
MSLASPSPRALLLAAACLSGAAGAQSFDEVPFVTSADNVTLEMLRIAGVGSKDHVIDLGSGDGRIVITAASRFGATGLGVEIVPELVEKSRRAAQQAGVAGKVDFRIQDLFKTDLSPATVVTMYLLPDVNLQLRPALLKLAPGTRIVSHDWDMGDWLPDQTTVLPVPDKTVGLEKSSKVHLWVVPARVEGLWCGTGAATDTRLKLAQQHQVVQGTLTHGPRSQLVTGRLEGARLQGPDLGLEATGGELRITRAVEALGLPAGTSLRRAAGERC